MHHSIITSKPPPAVSEIAPVPKSKQASVGNVPTKFVNTPLLPAGINPPNEKPRTVSPPAEMTKPASAAKPPLPADTEAPTTLNWKPPHLQVFH